MIDPDVPAEEKLARQAKIISALMDRAERGPEVGGSAYALFQSAITLQEEVWEKTRDLERALDTLGRASSELETARSARHLSQANLRDALGAMDGGLALFGGDRLLVCNEQFRNFLPDIAPLIVPGLGYSDYLEAVGRSTHLRHAGPEPWNAARAGIPTDLRYPAFVLALKNDRWIQVSHRRTESGNDAVLLTEISEIVRENREEKDRLIDAHAVYLQAAFENLGLGICAFSPRGELQVFNSRFGDLLGLPLVLQRKGTAIRRIGEELSRSGVRSNSGETIDLAGWVRSVRAGVPVRERLRRDDGAHLDVRVHALPDGGFIASILDVTPEYVATKSLRRINETLERRVHERTAELTEANRLMRLQFEGLARAEEELRVAKEVAEEANRAKTRFVAAASHDLLQSVNAAKLYVSALREKMMPSDAAGIVERLARSFQSVETLLKSLLDISRLDTQGAEFNVTAFRLDEILEPLLRDLAPLAEEKGIALRHVPCRAWVRSDPHYLKRSIQNLVTNAIQYTPAGRVLVGARRQRGTLILQIWDTGVGILPHDQVRIFDEFTRIDGAGQGAGVGLGLSIVERACRQLGHRVRLHSTFGSGSVFSIEMPTIEPPMEEGGEVGDLRENTARSDDLELIVMLVEEEASVLEASTSRLEGWGASVLGAHTTDEAIALVQQIGAKPDIIIAADRLAGSDTGLAAIRALRDWAGEHIPAIMMTADRGQKLRDLGEVEDFTVMTKPVKVAQLRALIAWKTRGALHADRHRQKSRVTPLSDGVS